MLRSLGAWKRLPILQSFKKRSTRIICCMGTESCSFKTREDNIQYRFVSNGSELPPERPGNRRSNSYRQSRIRQRLRKTRKDLLATGERVKARVGQIIMRENILTIPNILCVTRIFLSPIIGYLIIESKFDVALCIFVFAGITDLLDGYIARNYEDQQTMLGSFLDPFADKLLIFCVMLSLTYQGMIPAQLTSLVLFRDALLICAACYIRYVSLPPPITMQRYFDLTLMTARLKPTSLSKANTGVQLTLVATTLISPLLSFDPSNYLYLMWYFTAASTIISTISYATSKDTYELLRNIKNGKQKCK